MRIRQTVLVLTTLFGFTMQMSGQQIVIQVINGKTNKPVSKAKLFVSFPAEMKRRSVQLFTNENGEATFSFDDADRFEVHPIALVTCGEQTPGSPTPSFSVAEVVSSGVLTKNNCGRSGREPIRGKIVYFVRPAGRGELFKN
jgi:hypothetical protein